MARSNVDTNSFRQQLKSKNDMASNMSLYFGNSFSNKLFHKVFSRLANPLDSNTYTMEQHNHHIHEHIKNKHFTSKNHKEKTQSSSSSKILISI